MGVVSKWLLLCLALVIVAGCVGESREVARKTPPFPHKRHVQDEEMECTACHKYDAEKGVYAMPVVKTCMKCHEGLDAKKPAEKRVSAFVVNDVPQWSNYTALPKDVKFSHKPHADAKLACNACHRGIDESKAVNSRVRVDMRDCQDCHKNQKVGQAMNNCAVCHTETGKTSKPANHERNWKELHGRVAANVSKGSSADCQLCHTQASCTSCHRVEMPKNHSNFWREKGHGVTASLDRNACKTCHTEDSCVRCHKQVAPQSHKGDWADRHCVTCHLPVKNEGCAACHKNSNAHAALATKLPSNKVHQTATSSDCRTCHYAGRLLPHQDKGDDCLSCHTR